MAKILNIYIQDDNQDNLKKVDNQSGLINDLLREYFRKLDPNKMTPEEIRRELAKKKAWKEYQNKLENLK